MKNGIYASMVGFAVTAAAALAPMAALSMPAAAWANGAAEGSRHGHMWGGGGHMFYGPVMMILVIAVVVAIVVLIVRWMGGGHGAPGGQSIPGGKSPQDILKERYARGEMTTKEFEERRKVLGD